MSDRDQPMSDQPVTDQPATSTFHASAPHTPTPHAAPRGHQYEPAEIESKWQARWEADGLYRRPVADSGRPRHFALTMYPYPSGNLHIGHWYAITPSDARARYMRMRGHDVFFPMGFDAFGLPAENAAIKRGVQPGEWTMQNIEHMRGQLRSMGAMFDWDAEVVTCLPEYYRWNQWFFLQFLADDLAYRKRAAVDFCPQCNTTLAREQVVGEARVCERCGTPVVKRDLEQWFLRITSYADELLAKLDVLEWPERVKTMQRNWIGRSEGAEITFDGEAGSDVQIAVFTTRADTLYGATAVILAPEHPLVDTVTTPEKRADVEAYRLQAGRQTEIDRMAADREKTGVWTGGNARHPLTGALLPIWVADYVLTTYGTGAVMLVPAHDERDFAFADRYGLPIVEVIRPARVGDAAPDESKPLAGQQSAGSSDHPPASESSDPSPASESSDHPPTADSTEPGYLAAVYLGPGLLVNSGPHDGRVSLAKYRPADWTPALAASYGLPAVIAPEEEAKGAVVRSLAEAGKGRAMVTTRLRDWLISRQRYWGTPIPILYCETCGVVPVPEADLPVVLPEDVAFLPTGESPLKFATDWVNTTCPKCGGPALRDTDTMDTFVDSSWYQYRYLSPHYTEGPFDPEALAWLPVHQYTGGIEHATMHLLYTRFWTKVMRDLGLVDFDEPMLRLFNQGIILGEDSDKMSKSKGNVVDPDDLVGQYGADVVRAFLMFIGPWEEGGPWNSRGIQGVVRWVHDVWDLALAAEAHAYLAAADGPDATAGRDLRRATHQTIQKVTENFERFGFNSAVATLMEFRNTLKSAKALAGTPAWDEAVDNLLLLMAPIAPHVTEELWQRRGRPYAIHQAPWPVFDAELAAEDTVEIAIQVTGKVRDRMQIPVDLPEAEVIRLALAREAVQRLLGGKEPRKVFYVAGRLVNVVV